MKNITSVTPFNNSKITEAAEKKHAKKQRTSVNAVQLSYRR
jgi:hypothetical protein